MNNQKNKLRKIALIAAHPDDEALGVGGTLLKHKDAGDEIHLLFICDGITSRSSTKKNIKKRNDDFKKAMNFLQPTSYKILKYPDNKLDSIPLLELTKNIEQFLGQIKPDQLFTHFVNDLNIDHRLVSQACITATRPGSKTFVKKIFSFEVPSSTNWNLGQDTFRPNYYINISNYIAQKISFLRIYGIEIKKSPHARSLENIMALSQWRGSEVFVKNAEGFILLRGLQDEC